MNRLIVSLALLLSVTGCALHSPKSSEPAAAQAETSLAQFSANAAGGLPDGWEPLVILRTKNPTQYRLVESDNRTVLHARAENASSGLMQQVSIDPLKQPWLHWQWKIDNLLKNADNTQRATEDSPVRIILGFDGDKDTLPFADQVLFETAKVVTGHDFPYATLMYIWENKEPVGTVIRSTYSSRIKMMVVAQGQKGVGEWRDFARNIVEDYEKAFGEKPGKLIGVGVLTDTDNTGETVEAWYGDIRLLRERVMHTAQEGAVPGALTLSQRK
jgi:hypothetical protein